MVSIRFKHLIILCGLIAGSSIHALTPGMRAKIGDLTRDIKNKTINPTEARKRALALKISPSDMNDKSISNLILTADSVGIQDILNPASETNTKSIITNTNRLKHVTHADTEQPTQNIEEAPKNALNDAVQALITLNADINNFLENAKIITKNNQNISDEEIKKAKTTLDTLFSRFDIINQNISAIEKNYGKQPKEITKLIEDTSKAFYSAQETYENIEKLPIQKKLNQEAITPYTNNKTVTENDINRIYKPDEIKKYYDALGENYETLKKQLIEIKNTEEMMEAVENTIDKAKNTYAESGDIKKILLPAYYEAQAYKTLQHRYLQERESKIKLNTFMKIRQMVKDFMSFETNDQKKLIQYIDAFEAPFR